MHHSRRMGIFKVMHQKGTDGASFLSLKQPKSLVDDARSKICKNDRKSILSDAPTRKSEIRGSPLSPIFELNVTKKGTEP